MQDRMKSKDYPGILETNVLPRIRKLGYEFSNKITSPNTQLRSTTVITTDVIWTAEVGTVYRSGSLRAAPIHQEFAET